MANLSSKTGFTPVQTRVTLGSLGSAITVQDFAAYDSQELTGFVYLDATADLRASVKVMVVKNGAGTYEVASVDVAGDTYSSAPIVSFSMSGSNLRATLPAGVPGFVSGYIQYQLNAPALGGTFPLTVDGSNVTAASATAQGSVTTGAQTFAGVKTFSSAPVISDASGIVAASATVPGVVTTGTQTIAGAKTFSGNISAANLTSGRYTPTVTSVTNIAAVGIYSCMYNRVGNIVTVFGKVDVTLTTGGYGVLGISLPIASPGLTIVDLHGHNTRFASSVGGTAGIISGDATNKRATVELYSTNVGAQGLFFSFQYEVK